MSNNLKWNAQRPTEAGFYWLRNNPLDTEPIVVHVERSTSDRLVITELYDETPLSEVDGEWCGPLEVPE